MVAIGSQVPNIHRYFLECFSELSCHFFLKVQRLGFGQFRVSFTEDAPRYFEIVWLLSL